MHLNVIRFVSEKPLLYLDTRRYQCSRSALEITEYIAEAIRELKEEGLVPTDRDWVENVAYRTAEYELKEGIEPLVDIIPEDCPEAEKIKPELDRIIDIDVRGPGIRLADYLVKADSYSSHIYPIPPESMELIPWENAVDLVKKAREFFRGNVFHDPKNPDEKLEYRDSY